MRLAANIFGNLARQIPATASYAVATAPVKHRYNLHNSSNNWSVDQWKITRDFVRVCASNRVPNIDMFYRSHVHTYETFLRGISPSLTFWDSGVRTTHSLTFPIVPAVVTQTVVKYILGDYAHNPAVLDYFRVERTAELDKRRLQFARERYATAGNTHVAAMFQRLM